MREIFSKDKQWLHGVVGHLGNVLPGGYCLPLFPFVTCSYRKNCVFQFLGKSYDIKGMVTLSLNQLVEEKVEWEPCGD